MEPNSNNLPVSKEDPPQLSTPPTVPPVHNSTALLQGEEGPLPAPEETAAALPPAIEGVENADNVTHNINNSSQEATLPAETIDGGAPGQFLSVDLAEFAAAAEPKMEMLQQHPNMAGPPLAEGEESSPVHDDGNNNNMSGGDWQPPKKRRRKAEPMKPFNDMLYELMAFRARHGHCRVPLDIKGPLGRWVASLRAQKSSARKGFNALDLNPERLAVLDSIGFVWDLQQFDSDTRWKRQFEELCRFKAEHGHCNVPQSTTLGKWVKMQRENYRETRLKSLGQLPTGRSKPRPTLSQFRIEQLETLGFNWKVAAPAIGWDARFEELLEYKRMNGDCNVPQAWPENRQLGRWVMKQRCQYTLRLKDEKNQLSDDRVRRLEDIGFSWTAPSFRKKKETGRNDFPASVAAANHSVSQQAPHMMPPGGHLPPTDFRRWV